ncbi:MAG: hypothetical protein PF692_08455 [Kiritimatiellae bacterium]|jgi:hypothetical protein|nr:hypothetical protein [Kiritimatiellia bacterium]
MKTQREILFDILSGKDASQTGKWLLFPYAPTGYYVDVRNHPQYKKIHEESLDNVIVLNRRNFTSVVPQFTSDVKVSHDNGRMTLEYKDISLHQEIITQPDGSRKVKKLLSSEEDLIKFSSLPVLKDKDTIYKYIDDKVDEYLKEKEVFPEKYGSMMLDAGEPIAHLYHVSELEEFSIWSLTANEYVKTYLNNAMERFRHIYTYCLEKILLIYTLWLAASSHPLHLLVEKHFRNGLFHTLRSLLHSFTHMKNLLSSTIMDRSKKFFLTF